MYFGPLCIVIVLFLSPKFQLHEFGPLCITIVRFFFSQEPQLLQLDTLVIVSFLTQRTMRPIGDPTKCQISLVFAT